MKILTAMKFNHLLALLLLILSGQPLLAGKSNNQQSKKFEKSFVTTTTSEIHLKNRRGNIQIINIEGSEARIEVTINVKGKSNEEIQKVFEQYELFVQESGNIINVKSENNIKNWSQINTFLRSSNKMKFNDNSIAQGIEDIDINMVVYLPQIGRLKVSNKYHDILFSTLNCSFEADLYSGKLRGDNISGDFTLTMKYGKVDIANFTNGDIDIYESDFTSGNGNNLKLKSKYSDIFIGNFTSLDLDSYDDDITLGNITEEFEFGAKYTKIKMGSFDTADMDIYDTDVKGKGGKKLTLRSKYGSFKFEQIDDSSLRLYEDDFDVESVKDFEIKESKYSEISIDEFLGGDVEINSSYQDDITFSNSIKEFKSLSFESKYTTLKFPLKSGVKYQLEAKTKYGDLEFAKSFEHSYRDKENSTFEIKGMANGATSSNPKITINSYDSKIDLSF